jgi:hypothetical protein
MWLSITGRLKALKALVTSSSGPGLADLSVAGNMGGVNPYATGGIGNDVNGSLPPVFGPSGPVINNFTPTATVTNPNAPYDPFASLIQDLNGNPLDAGLFPSGISGVSYNMVPVGSIDQIGNGAIYESTGILNNE